VPAGNPADAWPRHAIPLSLLIAAVGFVVALVGIGLAAGSPPAVVYAAVFAAFGAQVGFAWLLRGFFERWSRTGSPCCRRRGRSGSPRSAA
jgi:hypothetical protein